MMWNDGIGVEMSVDVAGRASQRGRSPPEEDPLNNSVFIPSNRLCPVLGGESTNKKVASADFGPENYAVIFLPWCLYIVELYNFEANTSAINSTCDFLV